jgi:hypothetical protein
LIFLWLEIFAPNQYIIYLRYNVLLYYIADTTVVKTVKGDKGVKGDRGEKGTVGNLGPGGNPVSMIYYLFFIPTKMHPSRLYRKGI